MRPRSLLALSLPLVLCTALVWWLATAGDPTLRAWALPVTGVLSLTGLGMTLWNMVRPTGWLGPMGMAWLLLPPFALTGAGNTLTRAYHSACLPSEEVRQTLLSLRQDDGSWPAQLPPLSWAARGARLGHPDLLRYARSADGHAFTLSCSDGWIQWTGTDTDPMDPRK